MTNPAETGQNRSQDQNEPVGNDQTIVEIGSERLPVYKMFGEESLQKIKKGSPYIGIHYDEASLKNADKQFGDFVVGDLRELPLKDESADQVWLMNVFSAFRNRPKRRPDGSSELSLGMKDVFTELSRVLKDGGKIYIGEIYYPMREVDWLPEEDYSDFGLKKKVYVGKEEAGKFLEEMKASPALSETINHADGHEPFFMVLEKQKEQK